MAQIEKRETKGGVRWTARVFIARDANGKRKFVTRTFGTKKEADAWARKTESRKDTGTLGEPSRETVLEYLRRWLEEIASSKVRARTLDDYRGAVRRYVEPTLPGAPLIGPLRIDRLTPQTVQSFYSYLHQERGLSPRTIRSLHAVVRQAFQHAVRLGTLPRNPAAAVQLPRMVRKEQKAMTREEARAFLEAAQEDRLHALWVVLLTGGLRPGEALALRWEDLEGDRIQVRRSLVRRGVEGWVFEQPKTAKGTRTVALPELALRAIRAHRAQQAQEKLRAGADYTDHGLIFASEVGGPLNGANLYARNFKRITKAAELGAWEGEGKSRRFVPGFRVYDLRHTAATLLLQAGENVKVISERLGHASVVITLDTYSHVLPDMQTGAAEKMDAMLGSG